MMRGDGPWERFIEPVASVADQQSAAYLAAVPRRRANRKAAVVVVTAAVALTALNFGGTTSPDWIVTLLESLGLDGVAASARRAFFVGPDAQLNGLMFWAVIQVLSYVAIPVFVIKVVLKERVSEYGTRVRGIASHGGTYMVLFLLSVPFIVYASTTVSFQAKYPFYDLGIGEGLWPNMWLWWLFYAVQFMALEFFFRGFLVHGLKWRLGSMAVWFMVVPYNMLHFNKPAIEALAAIVGGVVLGFLSLRTKSVWWGAALHIAVAATMDILALSQKGFLF